MQGFHDDQIAYFAGSLDDQQRVYLSRLLGECLSSSCDQGLAPAERIALIQTHVQPLMLLLSCLREFTAADEGSDIRPFAVQIPDHGHALITLSPRILHWRGLYSSEGLSWLQSLQPTRISVDLSRLTDVTSIVIAWLVTMAGRIPERKIHLRNPSDRIVHSLKVLKLERVLVLPPTT